MELTALSASLQQDGLPLVFVNVLLQQLGLPVPVLPTLLLAGSQTSEASQTVALLAAAVLASVLADALWYLVGRRYGYRVLAGLCRLSINPASCVSHTEARFLRWGLGSLIVAKFIPGFSTVAPPIAGALRMPLPGFLAAAGLGAALWAGAALLAGYLLRDAVAQAVTTFEQHTALALSVLGIAFALWIGWKFWNRSHFRRLAGLAHILPEHCLQALAGAVATQVLDRAEQAILQKPGCCRRRRPRATTPCSRRCRPGRLTLLSSRVSLPGRCGCGSGRNRLRAAGYASARPLRGGYEACAPACACRLVAGQSLSTGSIKCAPQVFAPVRARRRPHHGEMFALLASLVVATAATPFKVWAGTSKGRSRRSRGHQ